MTEHTVAGERLLMLPEKALFWRDAMTLFIADFHLGKAAAFRDAGIPMPPGTTTDNVERLASAVEKTGAERVVFLGDFLHAKAGRAEKTEARFAKWRDKNLSVNLVLVRGNHDDNAGDPPAHWSFSCVDEGMKMGPFIAAHHPKRRAGGYTLAGHIHPAVHLRGKDDAMNLPCFWFGREVGVLPAFGAFTGSAVVRPQRGDHVFVVAEGCVMPVTGKPPG
jgi:uncharacterized protein